MLSVRFKQKYWNQSKNHFLWTLWILWMGYPGQTTIATPQRNSFGKKMTLSVWWDMKGIIYY